MGIHKIPWEKDVDEYHMDITWRMFNSILTTSNLLSSIDKFQQTIVEQKLDRERSRPITAGRGGGGARKSNSLSNLFLIVISFVLENSL